MGKTSDNTEAVIVKGKTNVLAFHVNLGTATFDEDVTIGGALTMTGSSISIPDNQAASVAIGSTGRTDLLTLKTSDNTEAVIVKGTTSALAFHVDLGTATFDETVTIKGNSVTLGGDSTFTLQRPTHGSTDGGDFVIQGQTAAGTDKTGGDVKLIGGTGSSSTNGPGGDVILQTGLNTGSGTAGNIKVNNAAGNALLTISNAGVATLNGGLSFGDYSSGN